MASNQSSVRISSCFLLSWSVVLQNVIVAQAFTDSYGTRNLINFSTDVLC